MMQYAHAILLPKSHLKAGQLVLLASGISVAFAIFVLFVLIIFKDFWYALIRPNTHNSDPYWIFLIPVSLVTAGCSEALSVWTARMQRYKRNAKARITTASVAFLVQLLFALYLVSEYGLIIGFVLGQLSALVWQVHQARKHERSFFVLDMERLKALSAEYKIIWYLVPASLFIVLTDQLPIYTLNSMATKAELGNFGMCTRVLAAPVTFIAMSMSEVFGQKASKLYLTKEGARSFFVKTFKTMFLASIIPFTLLFIFAPQIFGILGEKWVLSGKMVQYFGVMYWFKFFVTPVSYMYFLAKKQKEMMFGSIILLVVNYAVIQLVKLYAPGNYLYILGAFALVYSAYYVMLLWRSYIFTLPPKP